MNFFMSELVGTMILTLFGGGVCANVNLTKSKAEKADFIVVAFGWGFAVAFAAYTVGQYSGAHINPAVTLGMACVGKTPWDQVPAYISGQMIGGILGAVLCYLAYLPHWKETKDPVTKLGVFATIPAIRSPFHNFLCEFLATAALLFISLGIGANDFTPGLGSLVAGFYIVAIGLSLGGPTGYAINPARDLGPRIAHMFLPIEGKGDSDWGYAWVPVVGPIAGGIAGALLYQAIIG